MLVGSEDHSRERPGAVARRDGQAPVLGQLIVIAFVCASCWLAIGLSVLAALTVGSGWLIPLLVAGGLLAGAGIVLFPAYLFRERARASEAALQALVSEASPLALFDASAREPRLLEQIKRRDLTNEEPGSGGEGSRRI